jgi:hypothetical protein
MPPKKKQGGGGGAGMSEILITNFHPSKSDAFVLGDVSRVVEERWHGAPTFEDSTRLEGVGLRVFVPDHQVEPLRSLTGSLILNNPIWIVKCPLVYGIHTDSLSAVFASQCMQGFADLSNLKQKLNAAGKPAIDFNDLDFVEFLLWRLGTESRDKMFYVSTLILTDNEIRSIDKWSPFFHFLPNLKKIHLNGNRLQNVPSFTEWPHLEVVYDKGGQKAQQRGQQQDGGRGDDGGGYRGGQRGGRGGRGGYSRRGDDDDNEDY